jgi:serine phosphatase RsbU (regulator of sigma subunit)
MGKGMPAAIVMATVRGVMRLAGRVAEPADAVREAASTLWEDLDHTGTLVTLCHARLSLDGRLRYADAGHGLMLWLRADGSTVRPPAGGLPLGVVPDDTWPEDDLQLGPGDVVLAFSDGLLELYGETLDALEEIAATARGAADAEEVVDRFVRRARSRSALPDDVTVVALRRP